MRDQGRSWEVVLSAVLCALTFEGGALDSAVLMTSHWPGAHSAQAAAKSVASATGLDAETLSLVNKGNWTDAASRLESLTAARTQANMETAWLAFADMFLGRSTASRDLASKYDPKNATGDSVLPASLVQIFNFICANKLDDAEKSLSALPAGSDKNALVDFAQAALSGKRGQALKAIEFAQKTVDIAPDFAWGYRTIGYLQARWLKDTPKAEAALQQALTIEPNFAEARDLLVDSHLLRNDFDGAIEVAQAGIKSSPRDAGNYYRLSEIYTQQWRLKESLAQLDKAIALAPDDARYHRARGSILRYQGQLNSAIAEQQKAVGLAKDKAFELVELAAMNIEAGNSNRAADNLREALTFDADNQAAHNKLLQLLSQEKRYSDLVAEWKRVVQRKPKDSSAHLGLAKALVSDGKLDDAIAEMKEAANLNEQDPAPHRELGAIYIKQKDFDSAAKEYTKALNINPSSVEDLVALGYCYAQDDDYMQAEAAFVTALALQQLTGGNATASGIDHIDLMRSLAGVFLDEGRYADAANQYEAINALEKATGSVPTDALLLAQSKALRDRSTAAAKELVSTYDKLPADQKTQQLSAVVDALLDLGKADMAQSVLSQAPEKDKQSDAQLLAMAARVARLKGDLASAETQASAAVALVGQDPAKQSAAYLELSRIQLAKNDLPAAETSVRKAIELNPKSYQGYEVSGRIFLKRGDVQHAVESGKKAADINPYWAAAYMLIGDADVTAKKIGDALQQYKKAVDIYPGLLEAHKSALSTARDLALKDEIRRQEDSIAQLEARN